MTAWFETLLKKIQPLSLLAESNDGKIQSDIIRKISDVGGFEVSDHQDHTGCCIRLQITE